MKRLLGGIFARSQSVESVRAASTPTTADGEASASTAKRWGGFLLPSASLPPPLPATDQETLKSVDVVMRGVSAHVKAAIAKMLDGEDHDQELQDLIQFVEQAVTNLYLQSCELSLELLKSYFASPMGISFCEQTAFPSLVLDFVAMMRAFAMKEELSNMAKPQHENHRGGQEDATTARDASALPTVSTESGQQRDESGVFGGMVPPLELLMNCVIGIASNETLTEKFRCELPNLIELTAEEYPTSAMFIRDDCSRALLSVSERNFNAGLAWYLLDCNVISKTIEMMTNYSLAKKITSDTAEKALQFYLSSRMDRFIHASNGTGIDNSAAAAAVSEALGLTKSAGSVNDRAEGLTPTSFAALPINEGPPHGDRELVPSNMPETFCLPSYDVRFGLKSVAYVLERTYRFTPVLLDEFQNSGGYALLLRLLDTCSEEEIPSLIDILTLLMPFGSRSESCDNRERVTSGNIFGARNVNAFLTMRDLLLNYITDPDKGAETAVELNILAQRRNEHLILQLLTQILHIYTSDYDNFVYLEPRTRTLALLLTKLPYTSFFDAQVIILRIVEYVCCAAKPEDPLPHDILSVVSGLLIAYDPLSYQHSLEKANGSSDKSTSPIVLTPEYLLAAFDEGPISTLSSLMSECLVKILRNSETGRYKQELSGYGLMDRGIYVWLVQIASCLSSIPEADMATRLKILATLKPHLDMYGNLTCLMLKHNVQECVRFRQAEISHALYTIVEILLSSDVMATPFDLVIEPHTRTNAFSIMSTFVDLAGVLRFTDGQDDDDKVMSSAAFLQAGVGSDLSYILELLQRFRGAVWRQILLLFALTDILKIGGLAIDSLWRACQGYEILVTLLSSLDLEDSDSPERTFQMMDLVLELLIDTLDSQRGNNHNADYFRSIGGYSTVASCIITSGVMRGAKREAALHRIFGLISGGLSQNAIIYHGDAVQIVFRLLPTLPEIDAINAVTKLLSMLESGNDGTIFSKKNQIIRLVRAGAFQWIKEPKLLATLRQPNDPLHPALAKWIVTIALEEDLSIPRLHDFLELVGKAMPTFLTNQIDDVGSQEPLETSVAGLRLLRNVLKNPAIRHISVGKPQGAGQTGRYVHVVNSSDRVWPPSSGYSFSCWLRFPPLDVCNTMEAGKTSTEANSKHHSTAPKCVPLCEGFLSLTSGDDGIIPVYGVLVGATLAVFESKASAAQSEKAIDELMVANVSRSGSLEWSFMSDARLYTARCADAENMDMWWRAIEQCANNVANTTESNALLTSFDVLTDGDAISTKQVGDIQKCAEEGSACIVSIYSLEASGSFVRAFFEQSTGFLRFHTGAVNSGPSINPNPKRTSVAFESVAIDDLRPASSLSDRSAVNSSNVDISQLEHTERKRDWHHFAFSHRKSVVGSSLVTVYIDGLEVATKKLNYPSAPSVGSFQAFMGSDAQVCSPHSALTWKVGPTWLTNEVVSSATIAGIFSMGPMFSHQFSGNSYRSVGDWPEALASSHLARAADRGIEIAQFANRLQLAKLGRSCRRWRDWTDSGFAGNTGTANDALVGGAALIAESMIAKKEELTEGLRFAAGGSGVVSRKEKNKVAAFRKFVSYDCAMSSFGTEIEALLGTFKLPEDAILFSLNTSSGDHSTTPLLANTQVHCINCDQSCYLDLARSLPSVGGIGQVFFPLLDNACRQCDFYLVLKMLVNVLRRNPACLAECIGANGYTFIAALLCARAHLIDEKVLTCVVRLAVAGKLVLYANTNSGTTTRKILAHPVVVDALALAQVVLNCELRKKLLHHLQCQIVSLLMDLLVVSNPNAVFNARQLRRAGLFQWILTYLTELGNEDCRMDQDTALEMRWCFPKFTEPMFEAILQYALSLLRAFMRIESHVDDINGMAELVLLSTISTAMHSRESPIRVILLQFVLHEIENDASLSKTNDAAKSGQLFSETVVEAILYRENDAPPAKKRVDKRVENDNSLENATVGSPLADSSSKFGKGDVSGYPIDGFVSVLLEIIDQDHEGGRWISVEVLLAVRILLSLAQLHIGFAEHLLCQPVLLVKLKRVLLTYSTDIAVYIPLLAYVFSITIGETSYGDPDTVSSTEVGSIPPPVTNTLVSSRCIDEMWDIIGEQLLNNCRLPCSTIATEVNMIVLGKIACQVETSPSFFFAVCKSSGTLFRIIAQCFLSSPEDRATTPETHLSQKPEAGGLLVNVINDRLQRITDSIRTKMSAPSSTATACVNLIQVIMVRALEEKDFGSLMILFLEVLDENILKEVGSNISCVGGQKCWLALLEYIIESQNVMTSNASLISMKNTCTVCVALARYLGDEDNHMNETVKDEFDISASSTLARDSESPVSKDYSAGPCFGEEALLFLLKCCDLCSQHIIAHAVGEEEQQFFYGLLIYCAQTVVLSEIDGTHRNKASNRTLACLVKLKHVLLQRPNWEGIIVCGVITQSSTGEASSGINSSGANSSSGHPPRRVYRVRSLSANAHKEFGIGTESDRSFILSLASQLYRMLMDDSANVRHAAIVMWQFLINQRFDVLKEILIAEPRTSVLQTITSTKKETAVDIFHGGFDRLLYALNFFDGGEVGGISDEAIKTDISLNQEIWCQFQLWIAENDALLTDLIVLRTEPVYRHVQEVLLSCISIRKPPGSSGANNLILDTNFPVRLDVRNEGCRTYLHDGFDTNRRDMIAKKAVMKYASIRDSALESMNDSLSQWREMSLRLAYTRNVWQTGKWQIYTEPEPLADLETQRSVFQRKSLGYRLDTTEGPQRMRLRLVRDYVAEANSKKQGSSRMADSNTGKSSGDDDKTKNSESSLLQIPNAPLANKMENLDSEPFRRSLEFHEAVEVFREFSYQQSTSVNRMENNSQLLQNILRRCKMDSTRDVFGFVWEQKEGEHNCGDLTMLTVARALYISFLCGRENSDGRPTMGVSPPIIADIGRLIEEAEVNLDDHFVPSTIFDAADAEATQYALCTVRHQSFRLIQEEKQKLSGDIAEEERGGSDDDLGEEAQIKSELSVDGAESDDSEGQEAQELASRDETADRETLAEGTLNPIDASTIEPISPKAEQIKQVDTSSDGVYGAIARFLRRGDYPPIRSYTAAYIVGMGKTPGLFVICRFGMYFIGGYTKFFNNQHVQSEETNGTTEKNLNSTEETAQSGKLTGTPVGGKRKITKTLLRAALTDLSMQFTQSKAGGEQFFTVLPLSESTAQLEKSTTPPSLTFPSISSRWNIKYLNVKQFCRIKYQLRPVGIEFFDTYGSTYFLQLETSADREEVVKLLFQMPLVNSIFWSPVLRTGALVPSIKRIRQAVTKRWLRGSMTNFEYLIHLNTLAGRSFNDITQYPVLPWILADYTSEFLDLEAHDTYRDLSKPMGAIGPNRAAQFCERYAALSQDMDADELVGTPAFHYGTHYSCSAYVINYLIRLEPFTALARELQGGEFDHPDRLFRSIPSSWTSASRDNLQDVRELVPEFFYLPEFLYNANNCVFGITQSGEEVCHVILPPWANGDPREFVRLNRRALESKYVSEHLHEWIDLIFGVKQTGQAAIDAQNVFMHFTYEGTVDIEQITDPVMRAATLAQIENFGQTPSRLFSSPHPQRKIPTLTPTASTVGSMADAASTSMNPSAGHQYDGMTLSNVEAYVKWHTPLAPALVAIGKDYVFLKKSSAISVQVNGGAIGDVKLVHDKMQCQSIGCIFMPPRFAKYLDWGDGSGVMKLRVHQQSSGAGRYRETNKVLAIIEGAHHGGINCASVSDGGELLVSGGQDAVVNLIECSKAPDGRRVFKQVAKFIGHNDAVLCVAINKEFNLIASSSADRSVLLWDLRTHALLQELAGHSATVSHVFINGANGNVLTTTSSEIRLWSINGDLLAASNASSFGLQAITCAISTRCESWQSGVLAVTGHANGAIALWGLRYPADLVRQKKHTLAIEAAAATSEAMGSCSSPSSTERVDSANVPVPIQTQGYSSCARTQVVPSCQLFVLKLLPGHRAKVTALTLGPEQRQLLSGDAEGKCIRWVDDSIINIPPTFMDSFSIDPSIVELPPELAIAWRLPDEVDIEQRAAENHRRTLLRGANSALVFSTVTYPLRRICPNHDIRDALEQRAVALQQIRIEAMMVMNFHCCRLFEHHQRSYPNLSVVPTRTHAAVNALRLDRATFYRCCTAAFGDEQMPAPKPLANAALEESINVYKASRSRIISYMPPTLFYSSSAIKEMANDMLVAAKQHVRTNFEARLVNFISLQLAYPRGAAEAMVARLKSSTTTLTDTERVSQVAIHGVTIQTQGRRKTRQACRPDRGP